MISDYETYLDELLIAVAEQQTGGQIRSINLKSIDDNLFPDAPETWLMTAATALHKAGYGVDWQSTDNLWFHIDGGGLRRVAELRRKKANATLWGRIKSMPRSDWIALAALFVSLIALFR